MKKYSIRLIIWLIIILATATTAIAATLNNATYYGNLQITNNGSAATNQSATFTLNTTALINAGFVNASLNNTAIQNDAGADTPFMPGFNGSNPWAVWVSSITSGVGGGNATLPYTLYTGGNQSMASQLRYFPGAAGMNTTDNASLELGANFTINQTAFINTSAGANKTLVYKPGAITTNVTGTGNITSTLHGTSVTKAILSPTANATGGLSVFGAASAWQAVLTNDTNTSYIYNSAASNLSETFNFTAVTEYDQVPITGVAVFWVGASLVANPGQAMINTGGLNYYGNVSALNSTWTVYSTNWTTNPNTSTLWSWADIRSSSVGVVLRGSDSTTNAANCTSVYVVIYTELSVTASSVATENHTVITQSSGNFTSIGVDKSANTTAPNATGLVLNLPLFHADLDGTLFLSKDSYGHTVNVTGATWNSSGRTFDGIDDYVDAGNGTGLSINGSFSISAWVYTAGTGTGLKSIVTKGGGVTTNYALTFYDNNNSLAFFVYDAGGTARGIMAPSNSILPLTAWSHVVGIYNGAEFIIYVNGANTSDTYSWNNTGMVQTSANTLIGARGGAQFFNGQISETQIYNYALNATEILTLYNSALWKYTGSSEKFHYQYFAGSVTDTANTWQFFTANATPYVQRHHITVNGTLQQDISWQYATVFADATGNGHTATPTFRTAGSSSNVTANLTSYTPYTQSTSTPTSPNASAGNITIAFTQPPNLYSELNITMPGAAWWNGVLDNANIPRAIFWFPWLFGWTCFFGLATHWLTKSLQVQGFVMAFLLILFSLMGGFGYWVAIEFIILALAFIIGEKQYGF